MENCFSMARRCCCSNWAGNDKPTQLILSCVTVTVCQKLREACDCDILSKKQHFTRKYERTEVLFVFVISL